MYRAPLLRALRVGDETLFAAFVAELASCEAGTTVHAVKRRNKTIGDAWEEFCVRHLRQLGWQAARLQECPDEILSERSLRRRDVGIDIVATDEAGASVAVQCKYRRRGHRLCWRDVATFEALCVRTGPWDKRLVMTTTAAIRREGSALDGDMFWGKGHFERLPRHVWLDLAGLGTGHRCGGAAPARDVVDVRTRRLRFLEGSRGVDRGEVCDTAPHQDT